VKQKLLVNANPEGCCGAHGVREVGTEVEVEYVVGGFKKPQQATLVANVGEKKSKQVILRSSKSRIRW